MPDLARRALLLVLLAAPLAASAQPVLTPPAAPGAVKAPALPLATGAPSLPPILFPSSGEHGALVNVLGDGVGAATAVRFAGTEAQIVARGPRSVSVLVPVVPHQPSAVEVVTPAGVRRAAQAFQVSQAPAGAKPRPCSWPARSPGASVDVAWVTPREARPGQTFTLLGANLDKATAVSVGDVMLDLVESTRDRLVVRVLPRAPVGSGYLAVKGAGQALVTCQSVELLPEAPSTVVVLSREHPSHTVPIRARGARIEFRAPASANVIYEGVLSPESVRFALVQGWAPDGTYVEKKVWGSEFAVRWDLALANSVEWEEKTFVAKVVPDYPDTSLAGTFTLRLEWPAPEGGPKPPTAPVGVKK